MPDEAQRPGDLATHPGYRPHPPKGDLAELVKHRRAGQLARGVPDGNGEAVDVDL
ncbi:MAG: hypothetical protein OXI79_13695 [Gammaproteobacteria bacterium]|nr:hypothetical protein [Gammaproteobacteria bacterium]